MAERAQAERTGARAASPERKFWIALARAFGGAIFFALPLLMTMEMWWLGFYMDRIRLALFMVVLFPVLVGLSHYSGFEETENWMHDAVDAAVAYGVGITASAAVLLLTNIVDFSMPPREIIGKVALQAVPASFGAVLANSQLGGDSDRGGTRKHEERRKEEAGYGAELFFMAAGAVFFAFNVAPTEEMILIAYKMTWGHAIALAVVSMAAMHAFVYAVSFRGQHPAPPDVPWWSLFLRFTAVGYAIALLMSAYILWTFGRFDDTAYATYAMHAVVLGFPASLGAAAARLIL